MDLRTNSDFCWAGLQSNWFI